MAKTNNSNKEAKEILEASEEVVAETTEAVEPETANANGDKRVALHIPKGAANDEPNLLISVNSVNYLLPKGKTSMVPPEVAYEYKRAQRAQSKLDERIEEMLEASK